MGRFDGGSEFMAELEIAFRRLDRPLDVLPGRPPQYNGCVEQAHSITRCEFRNFYDRESRVADILQAFGREDESS